MDTIIMNSENSKTLEPYRLLLNLSDKINLTWSDMQLYQILAFTTHRKMDIQNNKSKISAPAWNDKFELPDSSCSVSDVLYNILSHRKHAEKTDNPPVTVYVNTIETRITFRKSKITNIEIGEYVAHLKIAEVA